MLIRTLAVLAAVSLTTSMATAQEYTVRLPNVDPPIAHVGDLSYPNHAYAMMRTFKDALEGLSGGRIASVVAARNARSFWPFFDV